MSTRCIHDILGPMIMAVPDFLLFTVVSVVTVYLPLFLKVLGYSATGIGALLSVFNTAGILIPLLLTPVVSRSRRLGVVLLVIAAGLVFLPVPLFRFGGFISVALFMALYAAFYRGAIPVCDTMISTALGERRDRYGYVRVFGSIGYVVMSLVLQRFIVLGSCTVRVMTLWMCIPAAVFALSVVPFACAAPARAEAGTGSRGHAGQDVHAGTFKETISSFGAGYFLMLFVMFMQYTGMVPANQFISLYLNDELHSNASGVMGALNAIFEIPFMFLSGRFIRRFGAKPLIFICTAAVTVRMACYAFVPGITGVVLGQALHSLTFGLFYPSCIMYCAQAARSPRASVVSMTLFSMTSSLANVIGSLAGGWLIDTAGYRTMFCIFGVMPLAGLAVYAVLRKRCACAQNAC